MAGDSFCFSRQLSSFPAADRSAPASTPTPARLLEASFLHPGPISGYLLTIYLRRFKQKAYINKKRSVCCCYLASAGRFLLCLEHITPQPEYPCSEGARRPLPGCRDHVICRSSLPLSLWPNPNTPLKPEPWILGDLTVSEGFKWCNCEWDSTLLPQVTSPRQRHKNMIHNWGYLFNVLYPPILPCF